MKKIFQETKIGTMTVKNAVVRSATVEGAYQPDGRFANKLIPIYEKLAKGGVGAIITGMMGVDANSRVAPIMVAAYYDNFAEELRKVVQSVHALDCKIIVQLSHCGQKAVPDDGSLPLGPSANEFGVDRKAQAMSTEDIKAVASAYALAATKCKQAGVDAVQLHCAHGYLLSQFLSPYFNKRTDDYGGSIANRARIVFEVYETVRKAVGEDFPIWMKINCTDLTDPSITLKECEWVCSELAKRGIDAVEISGGVAIDAKSSSAQAVRSEQDEGIFAKGAISLAQSLPISVISVCGYRSPEIIEKYLNEGNLCAVSLCRPLICEPDLLQRWENDDRAKSRCISCNMCFIPKDGFGCQRF